METHLIHNENKIKCSSCYQRGRLGFEVERRAGLTNKPHRQWKDSRFTYKSNSTYKQRLNMYLNNWTQTVKSAKMLKVNYKKIYSNINIVSLCISKNFHVLSFSLRTTYKHFPVYTLWETSFLEANDPFFRKALYVIWIWDVMG